jgi:RimJ/RimL family protein N-acetyltransferase
MSFNLQPTLQNELVTLRPLNENDFEPLYQVVKDPLIWEQHPSRDRYKKEVYTIFFHESLASKGAILVIDRLNNKVIGSSRFKKIDGVETAIEIGWSFLSRNYWGGKYNGSIKTLMIDHAFKYVDDIIFYIGKDNIRSQKAVEKIRAVRLIESKYKSLIRENDTIFTYRLNKNIWEGHSYPS